MDRKEALRQYKETPRPAGLYAVRNVGEEKMLVGTSVNLPGMLNRQRFQLEMGSHPDKVLQSDWNRLGPDAFVFEVLDELEMPDEPGYDPKDDLATLLEMWSVRLTDAGRSFYPTTKLGA